MARRVKYTEPCGLQMQMPVVLSHLWMLIDLASHSDLYWQTCMGKGRKLWLTILLILAGKSTEGRTQGDVISNLVCALCGNGGVSFDNILIFWELICNVCNIDACWLWIFNLIIILSIYLINYFNLITILFN